MLINIITPSLSPPIPTHTHSFAHKNKIATTIIGCKNISECDFAINNGRDLLHYHTYQNSKEDGGELEINKLPLTDKEKRVLAHILTTIFDESKVRGIWEHVMPDDK